MRERNYYEVLNVSRSASAQEIRLAYIKLVQRFHPDHNAGDKEAEARFKEVVKAHDTLKDPVKREEYNRTLAPEVPSSSPRSGNPEDIFADNDRLFEDIFGFSANESTSGRHKGKKK